MYYESDEWDTIALVRPISTRHSCSVTNDDRELDDVATQLRPCTWHGAIKRHRGLRFVGSKWHHPPYRKVGQLECALSLICSVQTDE